MTHRFLNFVLSLPARAQRDVVSWLHRVGNIATDSGHWLNRNRRDLLGILTAVMIAVLVIGFINQQNSLQALLHGDSTIINNQSTQLEAQKLEIEALGSHVDCLFTLATNHDPSQAYIANPTPCVIADPPSLVAPFNSSATTPQKSPSPLKTNTGNAGATPPTPAPAPTPTPTPTPKSCTVKLLFFCM